MKLRLITITVLCSASAIFCMPADFQAKSLTLGNFQQYMNDKNSSVKSTDTSIKVDHGPVSLGFSAYPQPTVAVDLKAGNLICGASTSFESGKQHFAGKVGFGFEF